MAPLETGLIGHWPLADDANDHSKTGHVTQAVDIEFGAEGRNGRRATAAKFNGQSSFLEVADHPTLRFGTGDLSVAAWVSTDEKYDDVVGDIVSKFDPDTRKGFQLYVLTNTGVTSTAQANRRNLQFGIDDAQLDAEWIDCGRPGNAVLIGALTVSNDILYAGTLETGADEVGHLWRCERDGNWTDLGNPLGCNTVHSIAEFGGALYAGLARYNTSGSVLGDTLNTTPGGKVYRIEPDGRWVFCGHPGAEGATPEETPVRGYETGKADDVTALTVYRGELYCTSVHRRGAFKYEGGESWRHIGPDERILSFTVYRGKLYAIINGGPLYRYEGGEDWVYCGCPATSTQTYSGVTHMGRLYVGTWPEGEVYRYEGGEEWSKIGSGTSGIGYSREIMGMALHNGKVYLGALPMANVFRMDEERFFTYVGTLDTAPAVLRRVWSMAVYRGRLFAGTLPSGRILSIEAGKMATCDRTFPGGWRHVAAVKHGGALRTYLDGEEVAASADFAPGDYDLSNDYPLRIGFGAYDYFKGLISDVRLYNRALDAGEIAQLAGN